MLEYRQQVVLKTLIEQFIASGQPVGSRILSRSTELNLSPASIRNIMADLEEAGLVSSPHTSAGRMPTESGYRLFVDSLLTVKEPEEWQVEQITSHLTLADTERNAVNSVLKVLTDITRFAGIVALPQVKAKKLRHLEFLTLGEGRLLVIFVGQDGSVENSVIHVDKTYSASVLQQMSNKINQNYQGLDLSKISQLLEREITSLREDLGHLISMLQTMAGGYESDQSDVSYSVVGENHLFDFEEFSSNAKRLRAMFELFDNHVMMAKLIGQAKEAEGVRIFIGSESHLKPFDQCSIVTANYVNDGNVVGTIGVIGPTRMAYNEIVPIVDVTARLLSAALVH